MSDISELNPTQSKFQVDHTPDQYPSLDWNPPFQHSRLNEGGHLQLPSLNEALILLQKFFDGFNYILPLFDQTSFMFLMEQRYERDLGAA